MDRNGWVSINRNAWVSIDRNTWVSINRNGWVTMDRNTQLPMWLMLIQEFSRVLTPLIQCMPT